ncbi:Phosphatidylinositol 4-kinase gamma 3 [Salvia divinorum]|uniref:1-phosphatidylinositol 4-kinase n=1 Tax=Salvia divinorum TaxID=28513 RepID=A0ABD1FJP4_SALDI
MSIASVALCPVYEDYWNFPGRVSDQYGPWSSDSILVYLTVGGSVIPMRVLESDSIASVKLRIQVSKGFSAKQQKLVFDGKELARNNSQMRDYGVSDGNVLHLVVRLSDLQAITVRTVCGKKFEFHVQRKRNVGYVKQKIAERGDGIFNLKDQELFCDEEELEDQRIIDDLCRSNDAVIHFLVRKSAKLRVVPVQKDFEVSIVASDVEEQVVDKVNRRRRRSQNEKLLIVAANQPPREAPIEPLIVNPKIVLSPVIKQLIDDTFNGLEKGNQPIRSSEGSGGAYFMQDSAGLKKGTRVGEGAFREVAAYILDHPRGGPRLTCSDEKGFAGVPPTVMVKCQHGGFHYSDGFNCASSKFGSLQMFMKNCGSCEDMGPRAFPVEEVHKICVLDIRLANADRHAGNILIQKDAEGQIVLIPIDHGYCMPENFKDCTFEWLYWPQAREPFSPNEIAYIKSLDAAKDIEILKFNGWNVPDNCARVFHISTMLLKKGAERGLTPFAIGSIMCRETVKKESVIEKIVEESKESVLPGTSESAFLESVSVIMDRYLDGLSP